MPGFKRSYGRRPRAPRMARKRLSTTRKRLYRKPHKSDTFGMRTWAASKINALARGWKARKNYGFRPHHINRGGWVYGGYKN